MKDIFDGDWLHKKAWSVPVSASHSQECQSEQSATSGQIYYGKTREYLYA